MRFILHKLLHSYLNNRKQYTSINDINLSVLTLSHSTPQGLVLGPLLFLIYINDLNNVMKHSLVHHFTDETNLLYSNSSIKLTNKHVNHDLKLIVHWLWASRILLNIDEIDIILFQSKNKKVKKKLNFWINGQKIINAAYAKHIGILLSQYLLWDQHLKMLK